ncbi:MAG: rab-GTPase-TBC domain-containing protein [Benjaminiella poitrasii]|nr:MAG: rab-GTPase-TBC domain-containing protein [Benjaminiella poitrasii]
MIEPETIDTLNSKSQYEAHDVLKGLPIAQIYNLWKLAGGDVELDLVKRGVFLSTPVIKRLPRVCILPEDIEVGDKVTDTAQLYSDAIYVLGFKELYQRLEEGKMKGESDKFEWDTDYFILVEDDDVNFLLDEEDNESMDENEEGPNTTDEYMNDLLFSDNLTTSQTSVPSSTIRNGIPTPTTPSSSKSLSRTASMVGMGRSRSASSISVNSTTSVNNQSNVLKLPLLLREQDINYQYHRLSLFSELLRQYPASRKEIIHHAKVDIPPLLRGKVWAAVLGVKGDLEHEYDQINKYSDMGADRQIEVDVPRCHQYNQLLASSTGHDKLRRLLKAWVSANKNLVYWQGRFLNNFFLSDNAPVIQEYLAVFRHLLSFHDPELSSHLDTIGFMPDLYAIPWFLTLFTHVFPLDKIYHLWDKLLVGPSTLPLFAGIAILKQIRDTLLSYEFNDCIVLFSDSFPKVDIEKCVQSALNMCKVTPPSISSRVHGPNYTENDIKETALPISIEIKKAELAPRLSVKELPKILSYSLILDIRPEADYANILKKLNRKYHIVVANEGGPEVTKIDNISITILLIVCFVVCCGTCKKRLPKDCFITWRYSCL